MLNDKTTSKKDVLFLIIFLVFIVATAGYLIMGLKTNIVPPSGDTNPELPLVSQIPPDKLPHYQLADSPLAFPALIDAAKSWAFNTKFISCTGTGTVYAQDGNTYQLGYDKGAFYKWVCFVYSKDKKEDTIIEWQGGRTNIRSPHVFYTGSSTEADPDKRNFYDLNKFVSSQLAYQTVLSNGFNDIQNYQNISLGLAEAQKLYETASVWEVHEYSKTVPESPESETSPGKLVKTYFIEATTGKFLQTINK